MMLTVSREQLLEQIKALGSLQNVFLIVGDDDSIGLPMIWYPEIGLRYLIIEKDDLAQMVSEYLRDEAKVRQFKSEQEVSEAMYAEKWQGWNTCADCCRMQQAMREL